MEGQKTKGRVDCAGCYAGWECCKALTSEVKP